MKFSPVSLLFASIIALALACTPNPALAQHKGSHGGGSHGGGSHGGGSHGGGSHGGGSHGGGRSHASGGGHSSHGGGGLHGGGSHGSGRSHASGGGRSFHGGGSHGSGGGHSVGRSSHSGVPAGPQQRGGGSHGKAPALNHSTRPSSSRGSGAHTPTVSSGQWHSFGNRGNSSFTAARGPSTSVGDGQWHSFASRGNSSVTTPRGPSNSWQGGAVRSWNGQGHQMPGNNLGSTAFSRSAASARTSNRALTGSDRRFVEPSRRTTGSAISTSRVVSNIDHSRFGISGTNRFSFSNSQFGSHVPRFERPEFGGHHEFRGGESNFGFGRESSFGGDAFSFFPDLLGLALAFGSFGSRGFGLPGLALNLLESGFGSNGGYGSYDGGSGGYGGYAGGYGGDGGFDGGYGDCVSSGWNPGPVSAYWGPGVIPYPAESLTCLR
jgi:hypothetical protein